MIQSQMSELLASGRMIDFILVLVALEAVALLMYHRRTKRGVAPAALLFNLAAGACLLLAARGALTGAAWPWVAAALFGALCAHLLDLAQRWNR